MIRGRCKPRCPSNCLITDDNCDYTTSLSTSIEFTNDIGTLGVLIILKTEMGMDLNGGQCTCLLDPEGFL